MEEPPLPLSLPRLPTKTLTLALKNPRHQTQLTNLSPSFLPPPPPPPPPPPTSRPSPIQPKPTIGTKLLLLSLLLRYFIRIRIHTRRPSSLESGPDSAPQLDPHLEDLLTFPGGDHLTVQEILDASGEVVGKSRYATSYRPGFGKTGSVMLLQFVRPACVAWVEREVREAVWALGSVRHQNIVPMEVHKSKFGPLNLRTCQDRPCKESPSISCSIVFLKQMS